MCSVRRIRHAAAEGCVGRPAATDLCLATSHSSVMWRHWYTFPLPPPHLALTSLPALPAAGALPEAPLITSTLLCNHPHRPDCPSNANIRQIDQEAAAYIKAGPGSQVCQYCLLIKSRFKTRFVLKIHSSFWPMFTNPPLIKTSPVCPTLMLLSAVTCQISWKDQRVIRGYTGE